MPRSASASHAPRSAYGTHPSFTWTRVPSSPARRGAPPPPPPAPPPPPPPRPALAVVGADHQIGRRAQGQRAGDDPPVDPSLRARRLARDAGQHLDHDRVVE